jgi:hypothetical protein
VPGRVVTTEGASRDSCGVCADSTVLAHVMTVLNARHSYGLDLFLLSVDEGITGYRDDSLEVGCVFPSLSCRREDALAQRSRRRCRP